MKILQTISALFLSVLILLFSFGFAINKMVCLKSGNAKISFVNIEDCCEKENEASTPLIKMHCCDLSSTAFQLNDYSPSPQHSLPFVSDCTLPLSTKTISDNYRERDKLILFSSDLPPPLHGRELLSFISALII